MAEENDREKPAEEKPAAAAPPPRPPEFPPPSGPPKRGVVGITARVVLTAFGISLALIVAYLVRQLLLVVFLGVILAATLFPAASWLEKKRLPRLAAILVPFLVILAFIVAVGFLIIPPLVREVRRLLEDLPGLIESVRVWITNLLEGLGIETNDDLWGRIGEEVANMAPDLGGLLQVPITLVGVIANLAIVIITSILILFERDRIRRWMLRFMPAGRRERVVEVSGRSLQKVGRYMLGQLILMTIVGIGTGLAMFILDIPFALPIGLLAFIGEIIPYIGPWVAGVPAALLGFIESPLQGFIMTGWLLALQALESYLLSPIVQHRVLNVSPLAIVIVLVAGLSLFGILGALIAVPLVAIADIVLQDVVFPMRDRQDGAHAEDGLEP